MSLVHKLENYFEFKALGASWLKEIVAGLSVFLSLSYIIVVNPSILSQAGISQEIAFFATILISGLAMLFMGGWAKLPFVLAPGLEMNAYVAFFIVGTLGYTWQEALGMVFWSGVLFMVLTISRFRQSVIESIPEKMKHILSFSVGIFVFIIGLRITDLLFYDGVFVSGIGDFSSNKAYALYIGVVVLSVLSYFRVPAAVLISIVVSALYLNIIVGEPLSPTVEISPSMTNGIGAFDISFALHSGAALSAIFVLFVIDFYGSIAKFIGLTANTPIDIKKRAGKALYVDGLATVAGAAFGTSSVTTYVESAVGIGAGGRTGITAIVCGVLMLASFFALPLLAYIPVAATAPALLYVGYKLVPIKQVRQSFNQLDWAVFVLSAFIVVSMFSLDKAMLLGFGVYFLYDVYKKYVRKDATYKPNAFLFASVLILALSIAF